VFVSPTYAEGFSIPSSKPWRRRLPGVSLPRVGVMDCLRDGVNA
jgi:hypothetical protein